MNYYTSDLHFMNADISQRTNRSMSLEAQRDEIIAAINDTVSKQDTLYILGDLSSAFYDPTGELEKMKCKKVLVIGNHDERWMNHKHFRRQFEHISQIGSVWEDDIRIILCHYPLAEWDGYWKPHTWHFYGHVHNSTVGAAEVMAKEERAVNVGIDVQGFRPKTAAQLIRERANKLGYPSDEEIAIHFKGTAKLLGLEVEK